MQIVFVTAHDPRFQENDQAATDQLASRLTALFCSVRQVSLTRDPGELSALDPFASGRLVHAFHAVRCGIPCREMARKNRVPFVVSATGTELFVDLLTPGLREHLADTIMTTDRLILPCPGVKTWLEEHLPRCPQSVIIPPAVQARPVTVSPAREEFGLDRNHRLIVLAGGIHPVKNPLAAVQGLAPLAGAYPEMRLVIIGGATSMDYAKRLRETLALHPWASWIDQRPWSEMPWWFREAELVLNTSHAEGGSRSLLEAMAMGRPVLASDIPGNRGFVISHRERPETGTGRLYFTSRTTDSFLRVHDRDDLATQVRWILDNPEKAAAMGANAAAWIRKHLASEREVYHHWSVYREILG